MPLQRFFLQTRFASTSNASPFAFPRHAHPSPHQIFHLPIGASQQDIKARYYDLVRVHHPDSPHCRAATPAEAHARFQAITRAYDVLRGRHHVDPYREEIERLRREQARRQAYRRSFTGQTEYDFAHGPRHGQWTASADDRWKDRFIIAIGLLSLGAGLGPALIWPIHEMSYRSHLDAAANLAQARQEARLFGEERRQTIRQRVREQKEGLTREEHLNPKP